MRISSRTKYRIRETSEHTNYASYKGNLVPSVTSVLKVIGKESLMQWANSLGWKRKSLNKELDDASLIGTLTHNYIEAFLLHKRDILHNINLEIDCLPYELNEKTRNAINSFLLWYNENSEFIEPLACEVEMCCDFYGGTCDLICYYKGKLCIFDFKTSSDFHPTQFMQLSAYAHMYELNFDAKIDDIGVLRMDKKRGNKAELRFIREVPGGERGFYYTAFECALNLYRYMYVIDKDWE